MHWGFLWLGDASEGITGRTVPVELALGQTFLAMHTIGLCLHSHKLIFNISFCHFITLKL